MDVVEEKDADLTVEKKSNGADAENNMNVDTIFQPPVSTKARLEEELEWTQHRVSTLPIEELNLKSESIRVALQDFAEKDALRDWLSRVLNNADKKSTVPQNLQRGLELKNLSPTVRDSFLLLIVPMLQRVTNIKLKIWKRSRVEISSDLRLRLEHQINF